MNLFKSRFVKSAIAAVTAVTTLVCGTLHIMPGNMPAEVSAASTCVIDTSKSYQSIVGFGGMNHPEWTGKDLTDAQRKTAFGNGDGEMGLSLLRIFVNPNSNQWNLAVPTAKYASNSGATVFATPWEPPAYLAESGGSNGKLHLPRSNYGAYAAHLNNFGTYMKNNGVNLYSISVQNEPDFAEEWTYWSTDETTDFLANYGDKITSTKVMSPESFQYAPENASWVRDGGKKFYTKILNNRKAMENCDVFGTHMYGTPRDWMDFPALENSGKQIWMTEVYVPNSDANSANRWPEAIQVSENIHNALVVGNMSAYTWWYIRRNYGLMTEDGRISKRGYCMAQYSKFVRPGAVRIAATEQPADNVYVSAYKKDNKVTIVAVNKGNTGYTQNFTVNGGISKIDRYRTSANENIAKTAGLAFTGNSFFAQLPAQSVSTFVVDLPGSGSSSSGGSSSGGSVSSGTTIGHSTFENDTDDWKGRGSATVALSGRIPYQGTNALLVQNRTGAWNGTEHTLDTATFVPGKSYSFETYVTYVDGDATQQYNMTLQYKDASGNTRYSLVASTKVTKGSYSKLANANYTIPSGASNLVLFIETASGTNNFYMDEMKIGTAGTSSSNTSNYSIPDGWYFIKNVNSQKYLDVSGKKDSDGANVIQYQGNGGANQKWYVKNLGNNVITIQSGLGGGRMLDVQSGENKDGANIQLWQYNGCEAQQFKVVKGANGAFALLTKNSGETKAVDIYGCSKDNGANVNQWTYNGGAWQLFNFEATSK
ncbi:MAG: glucuronoarabinoxylan endo-1,4-beta-xylanase [Eubacterium sp.]|nr:glucuronoarabinoxylan endo-1,4-beta-xylanase [Eubacterium sp.]